MNQITFTVKAVDRRNEMHFEVQRTHAQIFRDRKKYTRKVKHKHQLDY